MIVGKSGCGKTTLLLNLLLNPGWLDYNKLFVFSKRLFQPEYQVLRKAMEHKLPKEAILWLFDNQRVIQSELGLTVNAFIECMAAKLCSGSKGHAEFCSGSRGPEEIRDTSNIDCYFFENSDDVPDPKELNPEDKNMMVFHDLLLEKQNACEKY